MNDEALIYCCAVENETGAFIFKHFMLYSVCAIAGFATTL